MANIPDLSRRGSQRKPKLNPNRYIRKKLCPMCGRRFNTRPKLFEHMRTEYEAEFGPLEDEEDGR